MTDNEKRAHDYTIAIINANITAMGSGLAHKHIDNIKRNLMNLLKLNTYVYISKLSMYLTNNFQKNNLPKNK